MNTTKGFIHTHPHRRRTRRHEISSDNFDMRGALGETKSIVEGLLPAGTQVEWEAGSLPLSVEGNASQIKQCVINLCANARDAIPKTEGRLRISLEPFGDDFLHAYVARRRCEERRLLTVLEEGRKDGRIVASVGCLMPGKSHVVIGVHDNRSGIDADSMERIFEPFFTTKPIHEGTGLGLSAVQGIVLNHNGVVIVDTAPGRAPAYISSCRRRFPCCVLSTICLNRKRWYRKNAWS